MKRIAPYGIMLLCYGTVLLLCLALQGCYPAAMGPTDPGVYAGPGYAQLSGRAEVYRGGRRLQVSPPIRLQPGDAVQTGAEPGARISFPNGDAVILDSYTRVHLSNVFIEFGRILARVQGIFDAENENIVAGAEGTEFVFEVNRDRDVVVTVLDGAVVCRSKRQGWRVPLNRGEIFYSKFPNMVNPGKRPATRKELDDIRFWIGRIEGTRGPVEPEKGYCCTPNGVFPSAKGDCKGAFYLNPTQAEKACRGRTREESGYCCSGGRVYAATAESCQRARGIFAATEAEAYRRCGDMQQVWCCLDGRVNQMSRNQCTGRFFTDRFEAEKNCRPPQPRGYCCLNGQVTQSIRQDCRGAFYQDQAQAVRACRGEGGYCCLSGRVFQSTRGDCKGTFYLDQAQAQKACTLRFTPRESLPTDIMRPKPPEQPVIR